MYRLPDAPLEPLFRACCAYNPSFEPSKFDIVTDRNNLGKLFGFVAGKRESIDMQIQKVGSTTIFQRHETAGYELVASPIKGRDSGFEKRITAPTVKNAIGHHRIISYLFGGLKILVRFEVGAISDAENLASPSFSEDRKEMPVGSLQILEGGSLVPADVIAEVKARAAHRALVMGDVMPQLWFSQTPRLLVAYHSKGLLCGAVQNMEMEYSEALKKWEDQHRRELGKMAWLLRIIVDAVGKLDGRAELKSKYGKLEVRGKKYGSELIPEDIKMLLANGRTELQQL
jgi:hypothetical protein